MGQYTKENTELFLKLYRALESLEKDKPKLYENIKRENESKFDLFRSIINNLSHNTTSSLDYPVIVSLDVLNELKLIVDSINLKAINKSIRATKILYVKEGSYLKTALRIMSERNVSHLPIFDMNFKVKGVISESSIIDIVAKDGDINLNKKVYDFMPYFRLNDNPNERYIFMDKDAYYLDAKSLFLERYKDRKRLGLIFITENGKPSSKVLGLLSAYSVLGD